MFTAMQLEIDFLIAQAQAMDLQKIDVLRQHGIAKQHIDAPRLRIAAHPHARDRFE